MQNLVITTESTSETSSVRCLQFMEKVKAVVTTEIVLAKQSS